MSAGRVDNGDDVGDGNRLLRSSEGEIEIENGGPIQLDRGADGLRLKSGSLDGDFVSAERKVGDLVSPSALVSDERALPVHGGWGRMGATHIRLAQADEDVLAGALRTAWQLRKEKNAKPGGKKRGKR